RFPRTFYGDRIDERLLGRPSGRQPPNTGCGKQRRDDIQHPNRPWVHPPQLRRPIAPADFVIMKAVQMYPDTMFDATLAEILEIRLPAFRAGENVNQIAGYEDVTGIAA